MDGDIRSVVCTNCGNSWPLGPRRVVRRIAHEDGLTLDADGNITGLCPDCSGPKCPDCGMAIMDHEDHDGSQ